MFYEATPEGSNRHQLNSTHVILEVQEETGISLCFFYLVKFIFLLLLLLYYTEPLLIFFCHLQYIIVIIGITLEQASTISKVNIEELEIYLL